MVVHTDGSARAADEEPSSLEAAAYIHQIAGEIAGMASRCGLERVAAALILARDFAADILADADPENGPQNSGRPDETGA